MNWSLSLPGEFGEVYKGILTRPDEEPIPVAVKTLKVMIVCSCFSLWGPASSLSECNGSLSLIVMPVMYVIFI